jgi:hypothetical protein
MPEDAVTQPPPEKAQACAVAATVAHHLKVNFAGFGVDGLE